MPEDTAQPRLAERPPRYPLTLLLETWHVPAVTIIREHTERENTLCYQRSAPLPARSPPDLPSHSHTQLTPSFSFSISTFFSATFLPVWRCLALKTSLGGGGEGGEGCEGTGWG